MTIRKLGWTVIETTNWNQLFHAYGIAADTPKELRNLINHDIQLRANAIDYLFGAVLHQGTIYSVTPPAVQVIAGILNEPILRKPLYDNTETHQASGLEMILSFLGCVGDSLNYIVDFEISSPPSQEELDRFYADLTLDETGEDNIDWFSPLIGVLTEQAILDLRAMADEILQVLIPLVSDTNSLIRREAVYAVGEWAAKQPLSEQAKIALEKISSMLTCTKNRDERAGLILALGRMDADVSEYLNDVDDAVQACAALFVSSPQANDILINALCCPDQVDTWFEHMPPYFSMHERYYLLGKLKSRGVTIEQMLPAALAVIASSTAVRADYDWGPVLQIAFPDSKFKNGVCPPLPEKLTEAQRAVLEALVANEQLWEPRNGNAKFARMKVGLPNSRDEVAAYIKNTP